jgi:hypothetical protein
MRSCFPVSRVYCRSDFNSIRHTYRIILLHNKLKICTTKGIFNAISLDSSLPWWPETAGELQIKFRKVHWLLGRRSELSMYNKLLLYKQVLRPVWTSGVQLWRCAKKSNIDRIQRYQNKVLRCLVNAPWYARNSDIHRDLGVETVAFIIARHAITRKSSSALHQWRSVSVQASQCATFNQTTQADETFLSQSSSSTSKGSNGKTYILVLN